MFTFCSADFLRSLECEESLSFHSISSHRFDGHSRRKSNSTDCSFSSQWPTVDVFSSGSCAASHRFRLISRGEREKSPCIRPSLPMPRTSLVFILFATIFLRVQCRSEDLIKNFLSSRDPADLPSEAKEFLLRSRQQQRASTDG